MAHYEKLPLESALDESPQISSLVNIYSNDARHLGEFMETFHHLATQLVAVHNKLTTTYLDVSKHLKSFSLLKLMPGCDPGGELSSSLKSFSEVMSEMSSWEHIYATQIADGLVYPISKFIGSELQDLHTLGTLYQSANNEVDRAISRYSRCRKKDPQQEKHEATEDVYHARKNFHMLALRYYSRLNLLQTTRQMALLQPILGLVQATRGNHQLGHESLNSISKDEFFSGIGVKLKGMSDDLKREKVDTEELISQMVTQSQLTYYPQPPPELSRFPPDTTLNTKSGYLNVHRKYMGVMTSWERQFVFLEGGNILGVPKCELAGSLLLELDPTTVAHATDTDDRLHVFTVVTAKKAVILQALNDRERDEWMLTIQKIVREGDYVKSEKLTPSSSLFAGVSQFLAEKMNLGSSSPTGTSPTASPNSPSKGAAPLRALRGGVIPEDAPIIFDILSAEEDRQNGSHSTAITESAEGCKSFSVRFLGCMVINVDTGQTVVFEVMRRILAARAIHDMFSTSHLSLSVSSSHLTLKDPSSTTIRLQHRLKDVTFWATHTENQRLVGYIVCQQEGAKEGPFSCYVFESDEGGKEICSALGAAARQVYAHLLDQKTTREKRKEETKLLLANIALLPDMDSPPDMSADGSQVLLDAIPKPPNETADNKPNSDA